MNRYFAAHGMILRAFDLQKDELSTRQRCHAMIYLLQEAGTNLGYIFSWNKNQPYSKNLADYLKNNGIENLTNPNYSHFELSDKVQTNIHKVINLSVSKPNEINSTAWYVLLASALYMYRRRKAFNIGDDNGSIVKELVTQNSTFTKTQCRYAMSVLKRTGFAHETKATFTMI